MQSALGNVSEQNTLSALHQEVEKVPEEHRTRLLQIIHLFRESVDVGVAIPASLWSEIEKGVAEADAGKLIASEKVDTWLQSIESEAPLPIPTAK